MGKSALLQIFQSDIESSCLWFRSKILLSLDVRKFIWICLRLEVVKESSALSKGCGADTQHPVCIPTSLWDEANDGASTGNVSAMQANDVLIAVDRTSKEHPIPPNLIKF